MPKSWTRAWTWWRTGYLLGGLLLFIPGKVTAQNAGGTVKVFLDCSRCDESYIRSELTFVDYVRDPQQADVHVFITSSFTVLSGRQYELSFIGLGSRVGSELNLTRVLSQDASGEETRSVINDALRLGLAPFLGYLESADEFSLVYGEGGRPEAEEVLSSDPWRHWVFNVYGGDFELDRESNRTVFDSRWGFYADHRSEDWKIRFRPYFNYDLVRIQREGRPNVRSSITRHGLDSYVIRSLGPHWSVGFFADYVTRDDRNLRHWLTLIPGVEYSVLPYDVATRRAITIVYRMGINYTDYFERTIFDKTQEWLPLHELDATVMIRRPWGDIYSGLEGAQYLNDLSKQSAEIFANFSVRLFEGFSFEFEGSFEMIRDQLSLPLGELSLEDILLQQRELATDYYFSVGLGLSYTFGSEFANVVNTRF